MFIPSDTVLSRTLSCFWGSLKTTTLVPQSWGQSYWEMWTATQEGTKPLSLLWDLFHTGFGTGTRGTNERSGWMNWREPMEARYWRRLDLSITWILDVCTPYTISIGITWYYWYYQEAPLLNWHVPATQLALGLLFSLRWLGLFAIVRVRPWWETSVHDRSHVPWLMLLFGPVDGGRNGWGH